ncbi:cell division ATP-binding protein FtsE [Alloscardovia theropitheci]|uniref:Cell division ATP-binding protein FtsE n=1 Tax=Alloscardovia theropitheci TaxID=2496842 RepID=A0A4R0R1G1_9BIFI|nr:cell division ATP-binding protein FtsE [Alloscardovia theropitheci]TCD54986.1 cell division ATP-binding protein FtsE [Alloscardovia theropitheci]
MALIDLENVSKVYDRATRPALEEVNLHINRGDFVFLVGASGAGKSTLLSLLLREEEISTGKISVAGNDLRRISHRHIPHYRRGIGFIFQDYKLLENMTVWENVAFALEVIGTKRSTIKSIVPQVLEAVGLTGKEKRMPHELSGGEAQRVAIARAYANHPAIILADEPTGNLDPTTSVGIMEVLEAINRTGTTIVMATHNEEIVNSMRKRVVELHNGRIVRDEENGMYDSALYFPDEEATNKSRLEQAVRTAREINDVLPESQLSQAGTNTADKDIVEEAVDMSKFMPTSESANAASDSSLTVDDLEAEEGVARLARNVHSGRTGRYGQAFASAEQTLTWGTGLNAASDDNQEASQSQQPDDDKESNTDDEGKSSASTSTPATVPAPPAPPAPPAFLVRDEVNEKSRVTSQDNSDEKDGE